MYNSIIKPALIMTVLGRRKDFLEKFVSDGFKDVDVEM